MKTKGFTLVELLVVIAILAILATVSVVGYTSYIATTEETAAKSDAASIADAIDVALVMNKKVYIEVEDGKYILIERTEDGVEYTTGTATTGYTKIAEIPDALAGGLSVDSDDNLIYESAKDVKVNVDTNEVVD